MESHSTDADLLARSVQAPALFAGLYERHGLAVRRYVVRRIGDGAGDDLASEVFVRAFRARGRYRAEHEVALPWLLGIANNVIDDHRRLERDTLLLVVWGELTQDEAAVALGVPVGTVSSRITRARKRLAAALAPTAPTPPAEFRLHGEANV